MDEQNTKKQKKEQNGWEVLGKILLIVVIIASLFIAQDYIAARNDERYQEVFDSGFANGTINTTNDLAYVQTVTNTILAMPYIMDQNYTIVQMNLSEICLQAYGGLQ